MSRQKKVEWEAVTKPGRDRVSNEHIYPQTPTPEWEPLFRGLNAEARTWCSGSLGNLLVLSASINSSLQNDSFALKKEPKYDRDGNKLRNGYSDGSHSEIEVSRCAQWGPEEIRERGLRLLKFMEQRWAFSCKDDIERSAVLF